MEGPVPEAPATAVDPATGSPCGDGCRSAPAADSGRCDLLSASRGRFPATCRDWGIPQSGVGKGGVEPPRPFGHTDLNRARLPFRHLPWRGKTLAVRRTDSVDPPPDTRSAGPARSRPHGPTRW